MLKSQVFSSEWNTERVREDASGDREDGEEEDDELPCVIGESEGDCAVLQCIHNRDDFVTTTVALSWVLVSSNIIITLLIPILILLLVLVCFWERSGLPRWRRYCRCRDAEMAWWMRRTVNYVMTATMTYTTTVSVSNIQPSYHTYQCISIQFASTLEQFYGARWRSIRWRSNNSVQ